MSNRHEFRDGEWVETYPLPATVTFDARAFFKNLESARDSGFLTDEEYEKFLSFFE